MNNENEDTKECIAIRVFHTQRKMFMINESGLHSAPWGCDKSHEEFFGTQVYEHPRGYYHNKRLISYLGVDFEDSPIVRRAIIQWLPAMICLYDLPKDTEIWFGAIRDPAKVVWDGRACIGHIKDYFTVEDLI